jgi:predicted dehydrogenase
MVVLFGKPDTINAAGTLLSSGVDGQVAVNCTYKNGIVATVLYGKIADSTLPTEIQGEAGTIKLDRINIINEVSFINRKGLTENICPETNKHEYYYEIAHFIDIIQSGAKESTVNTLSNSLITMEIMDEIRSQSGVRFPADDF